MLPSFLLIAMNINDLYAQFPKIVTDSRKAQKNSIFFALKGETFDGNDFAAQALDLGCNYAVVDKKDVAVDKRYIVVEDVLKTLQDLALHRRKQLNMPVVAITGTNGKTTTKELIKSVLNKKYNVYATFGNLNNHIGVPLTILEIPQNTQIAIIEMGANHVGEISALCDIARPTCGLITNIGKAHLEGFGDFEGVKKAKNELYDYLNEHNGTIFYNEDNPILCALLENAKTKTICYASACKGNTIAASPLLKINLHMGENSYSVSTGMAGVYNLENVLAATCVGVYFDVSPERIVSAIEEYTPQNNRSQFLRTARNHLLLDYYNANPTSMSESLKNFFENIEGDKMVILGDMFELGDESAKEHVAIINLLLKQNDVIKVVVGKNFYEAAKDVSQIFAFAQMEDLKKWLYEKQSKERFILLKGSRSMQMEQLIDLL